MSDFLEEKRREISDRLNELKPVVDEYNRLEAAASALASIGETVPSESSPSPAAGPRRGAGRPPGASRKKAGRKKRVGATRGRRTRTSTRAAEALSFVQGQPGITVGELAAKMGIKQSYLYRVLPGLEQEHAVEKQGRGWHPGQRATAVSDELQAIFPGDEVWCPRHKRFHSPPAHK
jgi:hypothetical protein